MPWSVGGRHRQGTTAFYRPGYHPDQAFLSPALRGVPAHSWRFGDMPPAEGITEPEVVEVTALVRELRRQAGIE